MMIKRTMIFAATCAALALAAGCSTTTDTSSGSSVTKRNSINAESDAALSKLYTQAPESRELVSKARGVLVFPAVISAGFVIGGSYGQGELRVNGRPTAYYSTAAGSVGLLAGADSKAVYILFMTEEALQRFQASNGWTAGADAGVSIVTVGASGRIDSQTIRAPVLGFVLTNGGLMANLSIDGTKFTKLDL